MEAAQSSDEQTGDEAAQHTEGQKAKLELEPKPARRVEEIVVISASNDILYQWKAKDAERAVRLMSLLLIKSADLGRIVPALGRADRFEINEAGSRVICLLQQESRVFVRLSMSPPAQ